MFVNQKSVALSSTSSRVRPVGSPSKARAMSRKLVGSWSSIQAATPTGESAMPYSVCGCDPMKSCVGMVLYVKDKRLVRALLFGRETRWRRAAGRGRLVDFGWNHGGQVRVDTDQFRMSLRSHQRR